MDCSGRKGCSFEEVNAGSEGAPPASFLCNDTVSACIPASQPIALLSCTAIAHVISI